MGLNAVVYRNREHLPFDPDEFGTTFHGRTGEFYAGTSAAVDFDEGAVIVLNRRLGNTSAIEVLAEAVRRLLGPTSLLQSRSCLVELTQAT